MKGRTYRMEKIQGNGVKVIKDEGKREGSVWKVEKNKKEESKEDIREKEEINETVM